MFYDQLFQCLHFFPAVEVSRRIIGITNDNTPGTRRDEFFKLSNRGQGEAILDMGGERHDLYIGGHCKSVVVGIKRFGDDDFITCVETAHKAEEDGFGPAGGNDDLLVVYVDAQIPVPGRQFAPIAFIAGAVAIFKDLEVEIPHGVEGHFWGFDVRLADVEMIYFDAFLFGCLCIWHEFPDRRSRHLLSALADG